LVSSSFDVCGGEYELTDAICELVRSGKTVKALELTGEWADVRDPEVLARLNQKM
jgi:dTDP-glucose pyrophosphorylase